MPRSSMRSMGPDLLFETQTISSWNSLPKHAELVPVDRSQSSAHSSQQAVIYEESHVPKRLPNRATLGFTQRMAAVSSRRPRRTLAIWGSWSWWLWCLPERR